ncbi:hypothetical protein Tco_0136067, partial [Tanacetum coccineum]
EYETIQMKKDDKDDQDEIKDKEDRRPIKTYLVLKIKIKEVETSQSLKSKTCCNLSKIKMMKLEDIEGID